LNKVLITLGYDHYTYISTTSRFDYLNRNAEIVSGSIGYNLTDTIFLGVEGNGVFTNYDDSNQSSLNDNETYSVGGFVESQLTNNLRVRVAGGAQIMDERGVFNIGQRNCLAMRKIFWKAGVIVQAEETGGSVARTMRLQMDSGRVYLRSPDGLDEREL
jgi:hypothetical protein